MLDLHAKAKAIDEATNKLFMAVSVVHAFTCMCNYSCQFDREFLQLQLLGMIRKMLVLCTLLQQQKRKHKNCIASTKSQTCKFMTCPDSITVAASNYVDRLSTVSNYGKCVNIIAPVSVHECHAISCCSHVCFQGEDIRTTAELEDDIRKTGVYIHVFNIHPYTCSSYHVYSSLPLYLFCLLIIIGTAYSASFVVRSD